MVTDPLILLRSIAFHVISNGPPKGPDPPWMSTPPLMVATWICTEAGLVACTPPVMVPVLVWLSSLPSTKVAPALMYKPPRMVTGASLKHAAPSGTTTRPYVPAASSPVHVVVFGPAMTDAGIASSTTEPNTPTANTPKYLLTLDLLSRRPREDRLLRRRAISFVLPGA